MFSCRSVWRRCGHLARTSAHRLLPVVVQRQSMSSVPGGSGENIVYTLLCGGAFVGAVSYAYITVSTDNARYNTQIEQIKARSKPWVPKVWPPKSKDDKEGGEEEKTVTVGGGEEEEEEEELEAAAEAKAEVETLAEAFAEAAEVVVEVAEGVAEAVKEVEDITEQIQVVETMEEAVEAVAKPADITAEDPDSNVPLAALNQGVPKEEFTPVEEATVPTGVAPAEGTPTLAEVAQVEEAPALTETVPVKGIPAQAEVAPIEEAPLLMEITPADEAPVPVEEASALIEVAVVEEAPAPAEVAPVEVPASMEVVPVKEAPAPEVEEAIVLVGEMPAPVVEASAAIAFTQAVETACEVPVESLVQDPKREYIVVALDGTPKPETCPKVLGVAPMTGRNIPSQGGEDALASE
ncbi:fibrous sheath CABYR-binding protein isoform X2 [Echeneis naucrates]|nr:protein MGARP isoform X2 [Echeneis naucrates]